MASSSPNLGTIPEISTADAAPPSLNLNTAHQITLIDQERDVVDEEGQDAERRDSEAPTVPDTGTPGQSPITQKLTRNSSQLQQSLKRQWTKRKYAKYDKDRYDLDDISPPPEDEDPSNRPQIGEAATATQTSYLERRRADLKSFLIKRKRTIGTSKQLHDTVIDILYENQRGVFIFGVPKYSSSSLLPNDPAAWQNAQFRASPVDIRNAQVPDPSWEWGWKSWYVDMSRDVDEEGWEYSLKFSGSSAWHGNHPWFHSFVRRRRWLRMRRRRDMVHHTKEKSHELTAEYFTIHPKTLKPLSEDFSRANTAEMERLRAKVEEEEGLQDASNQPIEDIASLIHILKRSAVDREKLVAVRKFLSSGGEELFYLSDRMEEIMSLFIYQSSRRYLLTDLLSNLSHADTRRESLKGHNHDDEEAQREHDKAVQQAENLMNAVRAADEQVKRLEFWSDIKDMARGGETLHEEGFWDLEKWQGLSPTVSAGKGFAEDAFASKQHASEGAPELHRHPEHGGGKGKENAKSKSAGENDDEDGDWKSAVTAPSKKSNLSGGSSRVLAVKHLAGGKESSTSETEGYVTAAESASELGPSRQKQKEKGKTRLSNLDGVEEGPEQEDENNIEPAASASADPIIPSRPQKQSVQIVEPVPEPIDDRQQGGRGGGGDES